MKFYFVLEYCISFQLIGLDFTGRQQTAGGRRINNGPREGKGNRYASNFPSGLPDENSPLDAFPFHIPAPTSKPRCLHHKEQTRSFVASF